MKHNWLAILTLTTAVASLADESTLQFTSFDGYELDGKIQSPQPGTETLTPRIIILLHGSGLQSMDSDLTAVTKGGRKNLVFKDLSNALSEFGFTVVRYHKRAYQFQQAHLKDPAFTESERYRAFATNPMRHYVEDAKACFRFFENKFEGSPVYLLGHSQGTYVASLVAHELKQIKGIALIGFAMWSTDILLHEQTIYRPLRQFHQLDVDRNEILDPAELESQTPLAAAFRAGLNKLI